MSFSRKVSLLTPECVRIEFRLAGLTVRAISYFLDMIVITLIICLLLFLVWPLFLFSRFLCCVYAYVGLYLGIFLVVWGYNIFFELSTGGRTPGKMITGLRVINARGLPVNFTESAARNLMRIIDIIPGTGFFGAISILFSKNSQRIGDLAAGTFVILERVRKLPS